MPRVLPTLEYTRVSWSAAPLVMCEAAAQEAPGLGRASNRPPPVEQCCTRAWSPCTPPLRVGAMALGTCPGSRHAVGVEGRGRGVGKSCGVWMCVGEVVSPARFDHDDDG